jgi:HEAT repeat protein
MDGAAVAEQSAQAPQLLQLDNKALDCPSLEACLRVLDDATPLRSAGNVPPSAPKVASHLAQFGPAAKQALLERATGSLQGQRSLADILLMFWPDVDARDVPMLKEALRLSPGGGVARLLGRIGTPDAIAALVEDVREHGAQNQSGFALRSLGSKALPYLLPLLKGDSWQSGVQIVDEMGDVSAPAMQTWLAVAVDEKQPVEARVAALRGLRAMGLRASKIAPALVDLLDKPTTPSKVAEELHPILRMIGDEHEVEASLTCSASGHPFSTDGNNDCLAQAAIYGSHALPYAQMVFAEFGESRNGQDRADGASFAGYVGYRPAAARLEEMLRDRDWRVAFAAARSLGWLGVQEALPSLKSAAERYWLPEVRTQASQSFAAIQSDSGKLERPRVIPGTSWRYPEVAEFEVNALIVHDVEPCLSERWIWKGISFALPESQPASQIDIAADGGLPAGKLQGWDHGEWGGKLVWMPRGGQQSVLVDGNVVSVLPAGAHGNSALVAVGEWGPFSPYQTEEELRKQAASNIETIMVSNGPSGYGYVLYGTRDESDAWRIQELARMPRTIDAMTSIATDTWAALSGNRAVIFSSSGIQGIAACVPAGASSAQRQSMK